MNPYFKEAEKLFRQAMAGLHKDGYEASQEIINKVNVQDHYKLEWHYELALYFAAVKNRDRFETHFLFCQALDAACAEKILTHDVVVNAFSAEELAGMPGSKDKNKYGYPQRERFTAINPAGDETFLRFNPIHKNEIEAIYNSLDAGLHMYLKLDQSLNNILLNNISDRVYADVYTEVLIGALRRLSGYMEDVRFLMTQEQGSYVKEVIIQNGLLYVYVHDLDDDFIETRLYYFDNIAYRYKDAMIREWLIKEYFAQGKIELRYGYIEEAVKYFKKAAAKKAGNFEIYHELGMLLLTKTNEFRESIKYLSKALGVFKYKEIFLYRALAYCKVGEAINANKDIQQYIRSLEYHHIHDLVSGGYLFANAGYNTEAYTLFSAALEMYLLAENKRIEKRNAADSDRERAFYDEELARNAKLRSRIDTGLSNTAPAK